MAEIFRHAPGLPGYLVSDQGSVIGPQGPRKLSATLRYLTFKAFRGGKHRTIYVHRLVLEAFHGPCPEGMEARHLNGDARDNRAVNLAWGTHQENVQDTIRHGRKARGVACSFAKLTEEDLKVIRAWPRYKHGLKARFPHVSYQTLKNARDGVCYRAGG